jgi:ribonuclease HI
VEELLEYLGRERTVNEAEYAALCLGLRKAVELGITKIEVRGDSKLIVNQVEGSFKLKSANLKAMHAEACELKEKFTEFKISHVKREFNKHADHLANMAVDLGLSPSRMSGDASTSAGTPFESGGGGLGSVDDDAKRRKLGGEQRYSRLFRSIPGDAAAAATRLGRGYHAYARAAAAYDGDASKMASGAPLVVGGGASRSALASARRSWIPLTRAAMGFARLRL